MSQLVNDDNSTGKGINDFNDIMKSLIQKIRYRKFETIDQPLKGKGYVIRTNTIVKTQLEFEKLEFLDEVTVVNYGVILGNIVFGAGNFINYGVVKGMIISEKGKLNLKKGAEITGKIFISELILNVGGILNTETTLGTKFTEYEKQAIKDGKFEDFENSVSERKR